MLSKLLRVTILLLLLLIVFQRLAFSDMILARGDTYNYFYPYWDARSEALLPLWTPSIFMGVPLLANPQIGVFYPPNWPLTGLPAPDAIRISILLHSFWAMLGAWYLYSVTQRRQGSPALLAALLYGLGGMLLAHVEQINQLQGLAWMPWLFALMSRYLDGAGWPYGLLLAMALALQIFSGHTQTVFISGVGLGLIGLWYIVRAGRESGWRAARPLLPLIAIAGLALLLALPQLLPTLELTGMSNRGGGGLNAQQATAFSLPPTYLGRALLPSYDGQLFTEYVASIGVIGLGLALLGLLRPADPSRRSWRSLWALLLLLGLIFAMGRFTPLYLLLADLPGFNLFRVPARWLALPAIALAMLAGMGLQHWLDGAPDSARWRRWLPALILGLLMLLTRLLPELSPRLGILPEDIAGPAIPTLTTLLGWGLALAAWALAAWAAQARKRPYLGPVLVALVALELFAASRVLPFNEVAPREVYLEPRFTTHQLQSYANDGPVMGRMLSVSQLFFDTGDAASLTARYRDAGLGDAALRHALVAIKRQEMLFPNLPLTWGLPSVDGFDGGVLPTSNFTQWSALILPEGQLRSVDGRLSESLALAACDGVCLPPEAILDAMDTQYLITDKVYDLWHEDVAYDTLFRVDAETGAQAALSPDFVADTVHLMVEAGPAAQIEITLNAQQGEPQSIRLDELDTAELARVGDYALLRLPLAAPLRIQDWALRGRDLRIHGMSLVDSRTGDFWQVPPPGWQRVLSSDVKVYARYESSRRAYLAESWDWLPDDWQGGEIAIERLSVEPDALLLHGSPEDRPPGRGGTVEILAYDATRVVLRAEAEAPTFLVLRDAHYPGWEAQVNGQPAPIYRANILFRAVPIPAGSSEIIFSFVPTLWYVGMALGGLGWLITLAALFWQRRRAQPDSSGG